MLWALLYFSVLCFSFYCLFVTRKMVLWVVSILAIFFTMFLILLQMGSDFIAICFLIIYISAIAVIFVIIITILPPQAEWADVKETKSVYVKKKLGSFFKFFTFFTFTFSINYLVGNIVDKLTRAQINIYLPKPTFKDKGLSNSIEFVHFQKQFLSQIDTIASTMYSHYTELFLSVGFLFTACIFCIVFLVTNKNTK